MKKFYLIYQITNNVNGKIYIGKHKTSNLDDDYFGSGKYLNLAKEKYGLENFTKTILFYCANEEEMNLLEHCVVTKEFCERDDVYNLKEGGDGGWDFVNEKCDYGPGSQKRLNARAKAEASLTEDDKKRISQTISNTVQKKISKMSLAEREEFRRTNSERAKKGFNKCFLGKHHTQLSKEKISSAKKRNPLLSEKNGMFNRHWYHDPDLTSCLPFYEGQQPEGWIKGKLMDEELKRKWIASGKNATKGKHTFRNKETSQIIFLADGDPIPDGFVKGKGHLSEEQKQKMRISFASKPNSTKNPQRIEEMRLELRPMYKVFLDQSFETMCAMFDYKYSHPNFCMACKKFLPEYVNGAKRKHLSYDQVWKIYQESLTNTE